MGVNSELIALAQGSRPSFDDVSFPTATDSSQETSLLQKDPSTDVLDFGEDAQKDMSAMPPLAQVQCRAFLSAAGDCIRRQDYTGATAHLERCKAVARRFGEKHLRQEIANRIQEVADCANGTHEAGYAERHVDRESEQDSPAAEILRQGPNTPLSRTGDLDKVLSLAHGYERFEHGREEHVSPYDSARAHLRDLAGPEVSDYQHGLAMSDLRYGMGEEDAGRVMRHLENAHAAHAGGDHGSAVDSLINAKNSAIYGSGHTRALQNVIRSAISHQDSAGATAAAGWDFPGEHYLERKKYGLTAGASDLDKVLSLAWSDSARAAALEARREMSRHSIPDRPGEANVHFRSGKMNWDTQREMPAVHGQDLRQHLTASKGSPYAFEHGHPIGHEVHPSHFSDDYGLPAANESDMEKMHEAQHASGSYHSHYHLPEDEDKPYFIGGSTIRQDRIADRIEE